MARIDHITNIYNKPFHRQGTEFFHTANWEKSSTRPFRGQKGKKKVLFVNTPDRIHQYLIPRHLPSLYTEDKKGKKTLYLRHGDKEEIKQAAPYLTIWKTRKGFTKLPSKEFISTNPPKPQKTVKIKNPIMHIKNNGVNVKFIHDMPTKRESLLKKANIFKHFMMENQ